VPLAQLAPDIVAPVVNFKAVCPEIAMAVAGLILLLVAAFGPSVRAGVFKALSLAGIAVAGGLTAWIWTGHTVAFSRMIASDGVAMYARAILLSVAALVVLMAGGEDDGKQSRGEFYSLVVLSVTGMMLLAASADLVMVFVALELLSLCLYVLAGFTLERSASQESALKYFLLGAFSSAFFIYGVALTYGATGSTNIAVISSVAATVSSPRLLLAGLALLGVGFSFKVAAAPFHMWIPDVYQGAPTSVTALMASGTKVAAFAAFLRVFVGGFGGLVLDWRPVLWVLAVLTMLVGAVLGVVQTDLKRLLAYSSIAHAGYILIGVVAASRAGIGASLYYLLAYALTVIGAFAVVARLERAEHKSEARLSISGGFVSLSDLAGLGARQPVLAGLLTLFLLSLAGIPPTSGFVSKFTVFSAAVDSGQTGLVVIGVATSVVAAFYYLKVIVMMFMQPGPDQASPRPTAAGLAAVLGITAAATVFLGVLPGWVLEAARSAARFLG